MSRANLKADAYTYAVEWRPDADRFVAKAAEWPGLGAKGTTQEEALKACKAFVQEAMDLCPVEAYPVPGFILIPLAQYEDLLTVHQGTMLACQALAVRDTERLMLVLSQLAALPSIKVDVDGPLIEVVKGRR